jgi:hypothetical protein
MKKYFGGIIGIIYVLTFITTPFIARAQVAEDIYIEDLTEEEFQAIFQEIDASAEEVAGIPVSTDGVTSCFDYYAFNSVQVNISSNVTSTVPGSTIAFSGEIINGNNYPIVNGTVYIKIFKDRSSVEKNANGPDVVDQFVALRGVSLEANEKKMVSFEWKVPAWSEAGNYQAGTFFVSNDKYNLLGLSFTDDIVGNTAPFSIKTNVGGLVSFDKDSVMVNEDPYYFAAFAPHADATAPVSIVAQVNNTTDEDANVRVFLKTYAWDAMHTNNFLKEDSKVITVPANGSVPVSFTVTDTTQPVYLNELSLSYEDTKSFLNVRFVRDGIDKLRINFPAVDMYPLKADTETNLFACIHNTADSVVDGTLRLRIIDESGKEIHTYSWDGAVGGDMMGIVSKFIPTKTYETFTITAELLQNGNVVETDTVEYSCDDFNACDTSAKDSGMSAMDQLKLLGSGIVGLLILAVLIFIKKKYSKQEGQLSV